MVHVSYNKKTIILEEQRERYLLVGISIFLMHELDVTSYR